MKTRSSPAPASSASRIRAVAVACLAAAAIALRAQPATSFKVTQGTTITFAAPEATAAFAVDECADAAIDNGVVTVAGKSPGETHVMVVTPSGIRSFDVVVTMPPRRFPKGFTAPSTSDSEVEGGYSDVRYGSNPAQMQSEIDFARRTRDRNTRFHMSGINLFSGQAAGNQGRTAITSAFYRSLTERRDITIFDEPLDDGSLGANGSIVRGIHWREGRWLLHAGYLSLASFRELVMPLDGERVLEGGYRYPLSKSASLTAMVLNIGSSPSGQNGHGGTLGTLAYRYRPSESLHVDAQFGAGRGLSGAAEVRYRSGRENVHALVRYAPAQFPAFRTNSTSGLHTDVSWSRHMNSSFDLDGSFYSNRMTLLGLDETVVSGGFTVQYRITQHWGIHAGASGSTLRTKGPTSAPARSLNLPAGLNFQSRHFGAMAEYGLARARAQYRGNEQIRGSLRFGFGAFNMNFTAERQTQAPTLAFIFGQAQGLKDTLELLGMQAATIEQIDALLSENVFLIHGGFIKGATINLVPVRRQAGGAVSWSGRGRGRPQFSLNAAFNDDHALRGSSQSWNHSGSFSVRISEANELSFGCSVFGARMPGSPMGYKPICSGSWRHHYQTAPGLIIPVRKGSIAGRAFLDENSKGAYEAGARPLANVEVLLDGARSARTGPDGAYRFTGVPAGRHTVRAVFHSDKPFFFTTAAEVEVSENGRVDFGIGYSLSTLVGRLESDAGRGVSGTTILLRGNGLERKTTSEPDGGFLFAQVPEGVYRVEMDEDSLPPGYSGVKAADEGIQVGAASPGRAALTVRALRSIAGRVLIYDRNVGRYVPVPGIVVQLGGRRATVTTDQLGRYVFRNLPAGTYTVTVTSGERTYAKPVELSPEPIAVTDANIQMEAASQ